MGCRARRSWREHSLLGRGRLPGLPDCSTVDGGGLLFVGDDWAEDHHDIEVQDQAGRVLARARLAEGVAGIAGLHSTLAEQSAEADEVVVGIETDRGPWVAALVAAGYQVYAVNPLQVARYR